MRKIKIIVAVCVICALLTGAVAGIAATAETPATPANAVSGAGSYSSSEEVVYALLSSDGAVKSAWVVGTLEVQSSGNVTVYGDFSELKNLTTTNAMSENSGSFTVDAGDGRFYWQGTLAKSELPWNVSVSYNLNGSEVKASQLAGASGDFELHIETSQNEGLGNPVFYENYMLQITVTLDSSRFSNIDAPGATIANSGSNKSVTYTVMPGANGNIDLSASVRSFELASISFAAVPYSMDIEIGDLSSYTGDLTQLSDAISELNGGIKELRSGAKKLADGAAQLKNGSAEFNSGLSQIASGSNQLRSASEMIAGALGGLEGDSGLAGFSELPAALRMTVSGLDEIGTALSALSDGYSQALAALEGAIGSIPDASLGEADIYALYAANPGNKTLDVLVANYEAAQTVKGTYAAVSEAFDGVKTALPTLAGGISEISLGLSTMADQISAGLGGDAGFGDMAAQYMQFHSGLVQYLDGVDALAAGYAELDSGLAEFADGTKTFSDGTGELADGVEELDRETSKLPDEIDNMADELLADYTGGEFELQSFLSDKNENVELVQFVFRTDSIELPKEETAAQEAAADKNFWTRFLDLFR